MGSEAEGGRDQIFSRKGAPLQCEGWLGEEDWKGETATCLWE